MIIFQYTNLNILYLYSRKLFYWYTEIKNSKLLLAKEQDEIRFTPISSCNVCVTNDNYFILAVG